MKRAVLKRPVVNRWLIAATLLGTNAALADASLQFRVEGQCEAMMQQVQVSGSQLRMDTKTADMDVTTLFDGSEELITYLMHDKKRFHQIEVDEDALDYTGDVANSTGIYMDNQLGKIQEQLKAQCAQMRKSGLDCASMPNMEELMRTAGMAQPKIEIRDTDRRETVAGVSCEVVERWENGVRVQEDCYATPAALPIPAADQRGFSRGIITMQRYGQSFEGMSKRFAPSATQTTARPRAKDSLPLSQVCYAPDGSVRGRVTLELDTQAVDEARFAIPAGYSKYNMQEEINRESD